MMDSKQLVRLIYKHIRQELTDHEVSELQAWIHESEKNRLFFERAVDSNQLMDEIHSREEQDLFIDEDKAWKKFLSLELHVTTKTVYIFRIRWWKYAAAVILLLVCVTYFTMLHYDKGDSVAKTENANKPANEKAPGKDGAILKLANGQEIILDNVSNGLLVHQGKSEVIKKDGLLSYSPSTSGEEILFNTLSTPRGRQFQLMLPDGSRIWLNAESSITYPTAFVGNERVVKVTGEVYMEILKNASKPFKVSAEETQIEVVGTIFNINSYKDEDGIKTTLLEGNVKVLKGNSITLLNPGQQAQVVDNNIKVIKVDVDKITAWKKGFFRFKEDKLSEAMKNIARWYDLDVVFEGNAANVNVSGDIPRNANLSELLKILAVIDVDAKIEGRKLILKAQ